MITADTPEIWAPMSSDMLWLVVSWPLPVPWEGGCGEQPVLSQQSIGLMCQALRPEAATLHGYRGTIYNPTEWSSFPTSGLQVSGWVL